MARKRVGRDIHGIFLLDKDAGITSNRALQQVRRLFEARKAGHTGSLDPFATGMLPICLGEASKTAGFMLDADKRYRATLRLGEATDSGDPDGTVVATADVPKLDRNAIDAVLERFRGRIRQIPPMYSALKHRGEPLYRLARRGIEIERAPRDVTIYRLDCLDYTLPELRFEVSCSKGTYIRSLASDIAQALGTCGHLVSLRRLEVRPFTEGQMMTLEALEEAVANGDAESSLLPPDAGLAGWPVVQLGDADAVRFRHGNPVAVTGVEGLVRVHARDRQVLGVGAVSAGGILKPRRVFVTDPERPSGD